MQRPHHLTGVACCQAWRRAPEILLGQDTYTEAVDMWAVGCIFGELLKNEPLFPAKSEVETLEHMTRLLGRPNEGIWPVRDGVQGPLLAASGVLACLCPLSSRLVCIPAGMQRRQHRGAADVMPSMLMSTCSK